VGRGSENVGYGDSGLRDGHSGRRGDKAAIKFSPGGITKRDVKRWNYERLKRGSRVVKYHSVSGEVEKECLGCEGGWELGCDFCLTG